MTRSNIDLSGKKFGRLLVICRTIHKLWFCKCECGNERILSRQQLTSGNTKSCGCLRHEMLINDNPSTHPGVAEKISISHMGEKNPNYGKPCSEETKQKILSSRKGYKHSNETKQKISISHMGEKNGMYGKTGNKNHFYGKHHTEKTKEILRSKTGGKNSCWYGVTGKEHPKYGIAPVLGTQYGKRCYVNNMCFRSTYEARFVIELEKRGIKWIYEKRFYMDNTSYAPDFYLPEYDIYIEIKGYLRKGSYAKMILFNNNYPNINLFVFELSEIIALEKGGDILQLGIPLNVYIKKYSSNL